MKSGFLVYCLVGLTTGMNALAQAGGHGGGPGGSMNPGGARTTTQPGTFPGGNPNQLPDVMRRPLFLSGKVTLEDGTPPPDFVTMQILCRATPRSIGYTDAKGRFNLDLEDRNNSAALGDVEENGSVGPGGLGGAATPGQDGVGRSRGLPPFSGCELRAYLPGFRSDAVNLFNRTSFDNPDVGTMILHRRANVEGLTISATTALAPKDARKAFDKGRDEEKKGKWEEAQRQFQKAVAGYPKFAAAWYELGRAQKQLKDADGARKSFAQALAADAKFVSPYEQLAGMAAREKNWQEVADDTSRLLKLNPVDFPQAWYSNALANYELKKMDAAEKSARDGIAADTEHHFPKINYLLAAILEQKQDYAGAAENMREYIQFAPNASDLDLVKKQLAEMERLTHPEAQKQ